MDQLTGSGRRFYVPPVASPPVPVPPAGLGSGGKRRRSASTGHLPEPVAARTRSRSRSLERGEPDHDKKTAKKRLSMLLENKDEEEHTEDKVDTESGHSTGEGDQW